jgi:hypothetical protein
MKKFNKNYIFKKKLKKNTQLKKIMGLLKINSCTKVFFYETKKNPRDKKKN